MKRNQDERFDDIAKGQVARLVHAELGERVSSRETEIVNRLVMYFRQNKLSNEMMLSGIAEIAGLRTLLSRLETEVRDGLAAQEMENGESQRND